MKLQIAAAAFLFSALCSAQLNQWFPPEQMMAIGVYYYPEAWSETQWERDVSNIKKFGFE